MAFAHEVIRQQIKGLTLSQCVGGMDTDILVGTGAANHLIYGGGSLDRFGFLARVNAGIENGSLRAEEYSSLSITFRYLAGSLGLPFVYSVKDHWEYLERVGGMRRLEILKADPILGY